MEQLTTSAPAVALKTTVLAVPVLGLVCLAFIAVVTVLIAARRQILPIEQIKSVGVTLLWIVPALALVALVGFRTLPVQHIESTPVHPQITSAVRDEIRSNVRRMTRPARRKGRQSNAEQVSTSKTTAIQASASGVSAEIEQTESVTSDAPAPPAVPAAAAAPDHNGADLAAAARREERQEAIPSNSLAAQGMLKVVETKAEAPEWADKEPVPGDKGILVSLSSQRFATMQEAEQQLTAQAVSYVKQFYHDEYPLAGDWTVPVSLIERSAVRKLVGEALNKDFGNGIQGTMYRAHLQLELTPATRQALHESWHGQIVTHRLTVLGSMLGLVTMMLATSAGYFRLDDLTGGLYRRRLKFAAASLIAAGSLVALIVV